jgi:hypothetical protein
MPVHFRFLGLWIVVAGLSAGRSRAAEPPSQAALGPHVTYGVVTSSDRVREVVAEHIGDARDCFRRELARRPDLRSVSVLRWEVQRDGSTSIPPVNRELAEVESRFEDPALRACLDARIATWSFPRHDGQPIAVKVIIGFGQFRATPGSPSGERPPAATNEGGIEMSSIDKETIRALVQAHASEIRSCYEARLASNPTLQGKVVIRWVIEADGSVSRPSAVDDSTTLHDPELHACMAARIAAWRFPKDEGGRTAVISYPWIFRAAQDGAAPGQDER